jgi:hypothetical protein
MIGAQRNENTLVRFICVYLTEAYLQLARLDRLNDADLSSHLLVLCIASADPWAVGWQEASGVRGGGEQPAVPGWLAWAQL